MTWKTLLFALVTLAVGAPAAAQEDIMPLTEPVALDPADPSRTEFGELIYRGGVAIEPGDEKIGGISGLEWVEDRLYAVTDDGRWLTITPDEIGGKLSDIFSISAAPLLDQRGKRLRGQEQVDAEAIARSPEGAWLVSFERNHRILIYTDLSQAAQFSQDFSPTLSEIAPNNGIETLAINADGGILLCGEYAVAGANNCFVLSDPDLTKLSLPGPEPLAEHQGAPTDAACASDGACYILFRSYQPDYGNRAAILRLSRDGEAETLATLLPPLATDNFEGLAVREESGRTYLYIVSDDNFSKTQRTLLMKFEIRSDEPVAAVAPPPGGVPLTELDSRYETVDVVLETEMGEIRIALEVERAPITAANFLRYVDEGRFDGTVFYRAMRLNREPMPNGLLQGGTRFDPNRILPGIQHEPTTMTGLSHTSGALSMAMGDPGTANGDFSIMIQDQTGLDAQPDSDDPVWKNGYAVFGYITGGMDVVEAIHASPTDPDEGEGIMKGQLLAEPVVIIDARRAGPADSAGSDVAAPSGSAPE